MASRKRADVVSIIEAGGSQYRLQQVWLDHGTGRGGAAAGWVRLHSATGAAAWALGYLFLASAAVGVWAAWDASAALGRFFLLLGGMLGSLLLVTLLARSDAETGEAVAFRLYGWRLSAVLTLVALLVAALYLVAHERIDAARPILERVPALQLSDNEAAGALGLLLPYTVALLLLGLRGRSPWTLLAGLPALGLVAWALVQTGSRGAWLGVLAGAATAGYLAWRLARRRGLPGLLLDLLFGLLAFAALAVWAAAAFTPLFDSALGLEAGQGAMGSGASRLLLWRDTLPLLRDYWFTGSGPGNSAMIYSTYVLLIHVPYLEHAHNLFLQVALEQGMVGMVALCSLLLVTLVRALTAWSMAERTQRVLLGAGVASVVALIVHGLFDAELYMSPLAPLIFLAVVALQVTAVKAGREQREQAALVAGYWGDFRWAGVGLALLLVLLPLARPHALAVLAANLGAVVQSQSELGAYVNGAGEGESFFLQDAVRRDETARLAPAVAWFNRALQLDPSNSTALRRLALLEMAEGRHDAARVHLEAAFRVQPGDRLIRQLLGELAALDGRPLEAAEWWGTVDTAQGQLLVRRWWYEAVENPTEARNFAAAVAAYEEQRQAP